MRMKEANEKRNKLFNEVKHITHNFYAYEDKVDRGLFYEAVTVLQVVSCIRVVTDLIIQHEGDISKEVCKSITLDILSSVFESNFDATYEEIKTLYSDVKSE
jgi:hypothetical protein